jgi:SSS family solute:Na+ symporter
MGLFYARPLRKTALETIPQYLRMHYGKRAGDLASIVSSLGIFFSAVASTLPGIQIIAAVLGISHILAAVILLLLVAAYVSFGGMKSAGVGGIIKMIIIWVSLCLAGFSAFTMLHTQPDLLDAFPPHMFSLFGMGHAAALANLLSLIVGILCTQTYIQAIFSASDPRTASIGAFAAALVTIPVGLPCAIIGMYMHVMSPDTLPILVLPTYLLQYEPVWLGGIAMGGIMLSLIGSIAGLSLGIGTMVSHDILSDLLHIKDGASLLRLNRLVVIGVLFLAAVIAILNEGSQILFWNYMSMALRGGGVFLPLSVAVFFPGSLHKGWVIASIVFSTCAAIVVTVIPSPVKPLFVGLAVSLIMLVPGYFIQKKA